MHKPIPRTRLTISLLALLIFVLGGLYALGSFDVFLISHGVPLPAHTCIQFGPADRLAWYCNGPLSTRPFPPGLQSSVDACLAGTAPRIGVRHCQPAGAAGSAPTSGARPRSGP